MTFQTWAYLNKRPEESREEARQRYADIYGSDEDASTKQDFVEGFGSMPESPYGYDPSVLERTSPYTPTPTVDDDYISDPDAWDQFGAGIDEAQASGASALAGPVSGFLTDYVSEDLGAGLKGWAEEERDEQLAEAAQVKRPQSREEILKEDPDSWYKYTPEFFPTGHEIVRSTPTSLAAATIAVPAAVLSAKAAGVVGLAALGKAAVGAATGMAAGNVASSLQVAGESYERAKNDPAVREELGVDTEKDFKDLLPEDQQKIDRFATDVSQSAFGHRLYTSGLVEMASFIPYGPLLARWGAEVGLGTASEMWDRTLYTEDAAQTLVEYGMPRYKVQELQEKMLALGPSAKETFIKSLVQEGIMGGGFSAFESITGVSDPKVNIPATASAAQAELVKGAQKEVKDDMKEGAKLDAQAQSLGFDDADDMNQTREADKERQRLDKLEVEREKLRQQRRKIEDDAESDKWERVHKEKEELKKRIKERAEEIETEDNIFSGPRIAQMNRDILPILEKDGRDRTADDLVELDAYRKLYREHFTFKKGKNKGQINEKKWKDGHGLLDIKGLEVVEQEQAQERTKKGRKQAQEKAQDESDRGVLFAHNPDPEGTQKPGFWKKIKQVFGGAKVKEDTGPVTVKKKYLASMFRSIGKKFKKLKDKIVVVDGNDFETVLAALAGRQVFDKKSGEMRLADADENIEFAKQALKDSRAWTIGDQIFINADGISGKSVDEVVEQAIQLGMFHEPIAHIGLKEHLESKGEGKFNEFLDDFFATNKRDIEKWVTKYASAYLDEGQNIKDIPQNKQRELAEEYLANLFVEFGVRDPNILAKIADSITRGGYSLIGKRRVTTVQAREMLAEIQREYIGGERNIITGDFFDRSHWLKPAKRAGGKEADEPQWVPPKVVGTVLETGAPIPQLTLPEKTEGPLTPTVAEAVARERSEGTLLGKLKKKISSKKKKPEEAQGEASEVRHAKRVSTPQTLGGSPRVPISVANPEHFRTRFSKSKKPPKKTMTAYKMFKIKKGKLYPLFASNEEIQVGEWLDATFIPREEMPRKAQAMSLAPRGGWHTAETPAKHLRRKLASGEQRVWAEVEISNDVEWQSIADKSKTRDIRDGVPEGGQYRFKRPANQGGYWRIAGALKINRVLSDSEVDGKDVTFEPRKKEGAEVRFSKEYHGAPMTFDKFSMDKIGTRGVQVYGWGMYFTNDKGIAETYASQVPEGWAKKDIKKRVYEVTLAPKEEEYLDLKKPLRKQSKVVKKGISEILKTLSPDSPLKRWFKLNTSKMTGEQFYRWVASTFGARLGMDVEKKASLYLLSKGIRGNRITTTRSKFKGRNPTIVDKVIFSEGDIKIDARHSKRLATGKKLDAEWKLKIKNAVIPDTEEVRFAKKFKKLKAAKKNVKKMYGGRKLKYELGGGISVTPMDFQKLAPLGVYKKPRKNSSVVPMSPELKKLNKKMSELEALPANRVMFSKQRIEKYKATGGAASWIEWAETWVPEWKDLKTLESVKVAAWYDFLHYTMGTMTNEYSARNTLLSWSSTDAVVKKLERDKGRKLTIKEIAEESESRPFELTNVDGYVSNIINNPDNNGNRYFQDEVNAWRFDLLNVEQQYGDADMQALMGTYPEGKQLEKLKQEFLHKMQKEILDVITKNRDYLEMAMPQPEHAVLDDDSISQAQKDREKRKMNNAFFKSAIMRANVHDLGPTRVRMPKPFSGNGAVIAEVAQMFENGEITGIKHLSKVFREKVEIAEKRKAKTFNKTVKLGKGQWVELKQVPEDATQEQADEIINNWNAMSDKEWCTSRGMESTYAYEGPMWIYQEGFGEKAESKLAIRFNGDIETGYVEEIQSQANDGTIPAEYLPPVKEFSKKVELGQDAKETIDNAEVEANGIALAESLAPTGAEWVRAKAPFLGSRTEYKVKADILELGDGTYALRPLGEDRWRDIRGLLDEAREARPEDEAYLRRYSVIIGDADLNLGLRAYDQQMQMAATALAKEDRADRIEILGDNDPDVIDAYTKEKQDKYDKFGGRYFLPEEHIRIVTGTLNVRGNGKMPSLEKAHELIVSELSYRSKGYLEDNNRFLFPELTTLTNGLIANGPVYLPKLETIHGGVSVSNRLQEREYNEQVAEKKGEGRHTKKTESYWNRDKDWVYEEDSKKGRKLHITEGKMVDRWPPDDWHTGVFLDAPLLRTMTVTHSGVYRVGRGYAGWDIEGDTRINVPSLELIDGNLNLTGGDQIYPALTRITGHVRTNVGGLAKNKQPSASAILKMKNENPLEWTGSGFLLAKDSFPSLVTVDGDLNINYPIRLNSLVSVGTLKVRAPSVELRNLTAVREEVILGRKVVLPNLKYVGSELETVEDNFFPSLVDVNGNTVVFKGFINPKLSELSDMYDNSPVFDDAGTEFSTESKENWRMVYRERNPKLDPKRSAELNEDLKKFPRLERIEGKEGQTPTFKPQMITSKLDVFWKDKGMDNFEAFYSAWDSEMTDAEETGLNNLLEGAKEERGGYTPAQAAARDGVRFSKKTSQPTASELESEFYRKTGKVKPDTEEPTMGININDSKQNFTAEILSGRKTMETRDTNSLKSFIGKTVGIIRTGKGKAEVVGYATVGEPIVYNNRAEFKKDQSKHLVKTGSDYDIRAGKVKYGYPLTNVRKVSPFPVTSKGIVSRKIDTPKKGTSLPSDKVSLGNKKFVSGIYTRESITPKQFVNPKGEVRTSKILMRSAAAHAMGSSSWNPLTRWTEKTQPFADKLLKHMVAQGTLPDRLKYHALRRRIKGIIKNAEDAGKALYDVLKDTKQADVIFNYLTTKGANPRLITDRTERAAAVEAKEKIDAIGRELVDKKLMKEKTRQEHEGAYLPQVYLKYLMGEDSFRRAVTRGGVGVDMTYLIARKDIPEGVKRLIYGEIKDPAYLASKATSVPVKDMAILDWLGHVAANPNWVAPKSMVSFDALGTMKSIIKDHKLSKELLDTLDIKDTKAVKVSSYWLENESARINDMKESMDLTAEEMKIVVGLTKAMKKSAKEITGQNYDTTQYRTVPKTRKYGMLAGIAVRKEIYDDIFGGMVMTTGDLSTAEMILGNGSPVGDYNRLWKWSKVPANPPSWVRNFGSNLILMNMGGVSVGAMPGLMISSLADMRKSGKHKGKLHQLAKDLGLTAGTFSNVELGRIEREFKHLQNKLKGQKSAPWAALGAMKGAFAKFQDVTTDIYGGIDSLGKMMMLKHQLDKQGIEIKDLAKYKGEEKLALDDIASNAEKWLFDYSNVKSSVRFLRQAPFGAPFISFTSFVAPLMLETAITKPWKFAPYYALGWAMKEWFKNNYELDDEDLEGLKVGLSEYLREKATESFFPTGVIPLPFLDANKRVQFLDVSYIYPWGMFSEIAGELTEGNIGGALKTVGLMGSPLFNIASAVSTGIDPFSRREIIDPNGTPTEQAMDIWWYAFNLTMPPMLHGAGPGNEGFGALTRLHEAWTGKLTKEGEARFTMGQAFGRMAGFNVTPLAVPEGRIKHLRWDYSQIQKFFRHAKRHIKNMYMMQEPKSEIAQVQKEYMEKLNKKVEEFQEKVRISSPPESLIKERRSFKREKEHAALRYALG